MQKSFKDMTTEEKKSTRAAMLQIPVSNEEVLAFDPMIHKVIKQEILKYWGNGIQVYSDDAIIGRLGMSFSDLMQFGRMLVCNQIRWFKARGINPETGKPWNAKMTTLIFQQLRNKFMSLSKSFASEKNGGQVVNIEENREKLQRYVDGFQPLMALDVNKKNLLDAVKDCSKDIQHRCNRPFHTNADLIKYVKGLLSSMDGVSHVCFDDIEGFSPVDGGLDPEAALLVKEEIGSRLTKICDKRGVSSITLDELVKRKKHTAPKFLPRDLSPLLMVLARKQGVNSQRELAESLGIGMTTLSNIIRGRSRGTAEFRQKLESRFGKTFDELMEVVNV